ncbi:hypothetical protein L218DRAFT_669586 [Marasmius fiardii PR-910]|nr:hypothetical protein L218DRAFT_669586 [Marasmius fiardii PR-910]
MRFLGCRSWKIVHFGTRLFVHAPLRTDQCSWSCLKSAFHDQTFHRAAPKTPRRLRKGPMDMLLTAMVAFSFCVCHKRSRLNKQL